MHKISLSSLHGLKLWLVWNLVTYVGFTIGRITLNFAVSPNTVSFLWGPDKNILVFFSHTLGGFLIGSLIGWCQSLIVGPKINGNAKWIWTTAIGLALWGGVVSVARMSVKFTFLPIVERIDSLTYILFGFAIGISQWLVLRRQVYKAGWWIVASVIGWLIPFDLPEIIGFADVNSTVAYILIVMIIPGIVTGVALLYLFEGINIFSKFIEWAVYNDASKKKCLILLLMVLMLLVFSVFTAETEIDKAYAVCSKEMSTREGYGIWEYEEIVFSLPDVVFVFSDSCNDAACHARRNNAGWYVSEVWETLVSCLL